MIQDFNLYTSKKHEKYPELYKLIMVADGDIKGLRGMKITLSFQEFGKEDIRSI